MAPAKKDTTAAAVAAPAKKATSTHPAYKDMIKEAILELKERNGSSRQALKKYIQSNFNITAHNFEYLFNNTLKKGVQNGDFVQPKGPSGTVKLKKKEAGEKKTVKKAAVKKAAITKKAEAADKEKSETTEKAEKPAATKKKTEKAAPKKTAKAKAAAEEATTEAPKAKAAPAKKAAAPKKKAETVKKAPAKKTATDSSVKKTSAASRRRSVRATAA